MWNTSERSPNVTLTDDMIIDAQQKLGVTLPASFIDALRVKNGGLLAGNLLKLPAQKVPGHMKRLTVQGYISIHSLWGIGSSDESVLETNYLVEEWGLPKHLVILAGEGHWWLAFDYSKSTNNPPIVLIDSDSLDTLNVARDVSHFNSIKHHHEVFDENCNLIDR